MIDRTARRGAVGVALAAVPALALAGVVLAAAPAHAAGDEDGSVTRWSVTPADESGEDGRLSIQHELDPGESLVEHIEVTNLGDEDAVFRLSAADGFTNANGRFDMLASDKESTDAGTWIDIDDEVEIDAGTSAVVPFEITVPEQAEPGDHAAGVAASVISTQSSDGGASVGVESRVGVKVITRVTGEIAPSMAVDVVGADYRGSWNPFGPGRVDVTLSLTNTGNTKLSAEGVASAGTGEAAFGGGDGIGDLLPGDTREVAVTIDGTWPTFYAPGGVTVTPAAEALDGSAPEVDSASADFGVWAMPWPQLLVLIALALIVIALTWNRRRGRRRLDALLAEAREEGRRTAEAGGASGSDGGTGARGARAESRRAARIGPAAVVLASVAAIVLAPSAAIAADDAPDDGSGVGVHVTITERDADAADGSDGDAPDGDAADGDGIDAPDADGTDADGGGDTDGADADTDPGDTSDADGTAADADAPIPDSPDADDTDSADDTDDQGDDLAVTGLDPAALITVGTAAVIAGGLGIALVRRRAAR